MIALINKILPLSQVVLLITLLIFSCDKSDDSSGSSSSGSSDECLDLLACNYEDDGSCEYPEENYDCDGDCITDIDCQDECGGTAEPDNCDTCDSNPYNNCELINGEYKGQIEVYASKVTYPSNGNAIITVSAECINCTNCLDCEVAAFQFNISSNDFIINAANTTSDLENSGLYNQSDEENILAFGIGPDIYISIASSGTELVEFEVEYSDNSGKIFIIPTKGSISFIDRNGEEYTVSTKNKKWSVIEQ